MTALALLQENPAPSPYGARGPSRATAAERRGAPGRHTAGPEVKAVRPETPWASAAAFLDHWDGVRLVTLKLLACFEDQDLGYRLVEGWRTVGELFHHIGGHQFFVARGVLLRRWHPAPGEPDQDWPAHQAATVGSVNRLHAWLSEVRDLTRQWFAAADDGALAELRPDNPWHEGIGGWLLLHHAYQDEVHHRGQLYAIARLLGKDTPPVFEVEHPDYWDVYQGR